MLAEGIELALPGGHLIAPRFRAILRVAQVVEHVGVAGDDLVDQIHAIGEIGEAGGLEGDFQGLDLAGLADGLDALGGLVLAGLDVGGGLLRKPGKGGAKLALRLDHILLNAVEAPFAQIEFLVYFEEAAGDLSLALRLQAQLVLRPTLSTLERRELAAEGGPDRLGCLRAAIEPPVRARNKAKQPSAIRRKRRAERAWHLYFPISRASKSPENATYKARRRPQGAACITGPRTERSVRSYRLCTTDRLICPIRGAGRKLLPSGGVFCKRISCYTGGRGRRDGRLFSSATARWGKSATVRAARMALPRFVSRFIGARRRRSAPDGEGSRRDTEIAVAVFRTVFLLIALASKQLFEMQGRSAWLLQVAVVAAAGYNVILFWLHTREWLFRAA